MKLLVLLFMFSAIFSQSKEFYKELIKDQSQIHYINKMYRAIDKKIRSNYKIVTEVDKKGNGFVAIKSKSGKVIVKESFEKGEMESGVYNDINYSLIFNFERMQFSIFEGSGFKTYDASPVLVDFLEDEFNKLMHRFYDKNADNYQLDKKALEELIKESRKMPYHGFPHDMDHYGDVDVIYEED